MHVLATVPVSFSSKDTGLQLKAQAGEGDVGAEKAPGVSCQESQVPSTPHRHTARAWHHRWSPAGRNTQRFSLRSTLTSSSLQPRVLGDGSTSCPASPVPWGDHLGETEGSQSTNPGSAQSFGATEDNLPFSASSPLTGMGLQKMT